MTINIEVVEYLVSDSSSGGKDYMLVHAYNVQTGAGWVKACYGKLEGSFQIATHVFRNGQEASDHLLKKIKEKKLKGYKPKNPESHKLSSSIFGKIRDFSVGEIVYRKERFLEINANQTTKATLSQFLSGPELDLLFEIMDDENTPVFAKASADSEAKRIQESYGSRWGAWS